MTRESVATTGEKPVLDRLNQALVEQLAADGGPPIYTLTPETARSVLLQTQSAFSTPDAAVKDWEINSAKSTLRLRTILPRSISGRPPVVMYFHGAGWVMGDSTTHDRLVRQLAAGAGAMVVFLDYSRAPEHRYPVAIEEAYSATC
jgi:acetyl esterase